MNFVTNCGIGIDPVLDELKD